MRKDTLNILAGWAQTLSCVLPGATQSLGRNMSEKNIRPHAQKRHSHLVSSRINCVPRFPVANRVTMIISLTVTALSVNIPPAPPHDHGEVTLLTMIL